MSLEVAADVLEQWDASTEERKRNAHWSPSQQDVQQIEAFVQPARGRRTWLDWGSGGGALLGIAERLGAGEVIAVDVSDASLAALPTPAIPVRKLHPQDVCALPAASVDVLCSFSTFQHFPSQEYGIAVLHEWSRLAKPGALGFLQVRYYEPGNAYDPRTVQGRPYSERWVRSCAYELPELQRQLAWSLRLGFASSVELLEPWRGYAWLRLSRG